MINPNWLLPMRPKKIQPSSIKKSPKKIRTRRDIESKYLKNKKIWKNGEYYENAVGKLSARNIKMIDSIFKLQQGYQSANKLKEKKKIKVLNKDPQQKLLQKKKVASPENRKKKDTKKKEVKRCSAKKMCNGKVCSALIKNNGNFCKRHRAKK